MLRQTRSKIERSSYDEKTLPQMLTAKEKGSRLAEYNSHNRLREDNQIYMPYESALGLVPSEQKLSKMVNNLQQSRDVSNGPFGIKADRQSVSKLSHAKLRGAAQPSAT